MNSTVAWNSLMPSSNSGGLAFSSNTVDAPTDMGNSTRPPRPKVKASGGLPMNTSSGSSRSRCGGQQRQMAMMSRWKCMVALGTPVVPEVKPSRQVSLAAVLALSKWGEARSMATSRLSGPW